MKFYNRRVCFFAASGSVFQVIPIHKQKSSANLHDFYLFERPLIPDIDLRLMRHTNPTNGRYWRHQVKFLGASAKRETVSALVIQAEGHPADSLQILIKKNFLEHLKLSLYNSSQESETNNEESLHEEEKNLRNSYHKMVFEGMILNSGLCVYALLTKLFRSRWLEFGQVRFCRG